LASETPAAYKALHQLLRPGEHVALLSLFPLIGNDALQFKPIGTLHQMVAAHHEPGTADDQDVIRLDNADAKDMLELAQRAKPGPFGKRTHEMGNFIGIRDRGRLIAMAGERMSMNGYVEISAVCVDEQWRGKGLGGRLVKVLCNEIEQQGETPFLHVFSHNATAIGLYERLGFELRRAFALTQISRVEQVSDPLDT
jgi:predicted GNAT family acetyltransferase